MKKKKIENICEEYELVHAWVEYTTEEFIRPKGIYYQPRLRRCANCGKIQWQKEEWIDWKPKPPKRIEP